MPAVRPIYSPEPVAPDLADAMPERFDPLYEIELALHEASKVSGALRAVACMSRAWHTPDHPTLDMTQRSDLADLLEVLGTRLDEQHRQAETMVFATRTQQQPLKESR